MIRTFTLAGTMNPAGLAPLLNSNFFTTTRGTRIVYATITSAPLAGNANFSFGDGTNTVLATLNAGDTFLKVPLNWISPPASTVSASVAGDDGADPVAVSFTISFYIPSRRIFPMQSYKIFVSNKATAISGVVRLDTATENRDGILISNNATGTLLVTTQAAGSTAPADVTITTNAVLQIPSGGDPVWLPIAGGIAAYGKLVSGSGSAVVQSFLAD